MQRLHPATSGRAIERRLLRDCRSPAFSGSGSAGARCGGTVSGAQAGSAFSEFFTPRQTSVYRPDATKRVGNKERVGNKD